MDVNVIGGEWTGAVLGAFSKRVSFFAGLRESDFDALQQLAGEARKEPARERIVGRGDRTPTIYVLEAGVAARVRETSEGARQIVNFVLPGDIFDPMGLVHSQADHAFESLTPLVATAVDAEKLFHLFGSQRRLAAAFWWVAIQEEGILREQIVRVGRRSAHHRTAHLLLELTWRARLAGADTTSDDFWLPLSQAEVADSLGLSHIHMNRVLRVLRNQGYIEMTTRRVRVVEQLGEEIARYCDFETSHLHLEAGFLAGPLGVDRPKRTIDID